MAENIKRCRAEVSPGVINNLNSKYKPEALINCDETNLSCDPGRKLVVVKRGCKHSEFVMNSSKPSLHLWDTWTTGDHKGAQYENTKSGGLTKRCLKNGLQKLPSLI
ncbi:hypothetical protein ILUMI_16445 [Ignelater luminosus]|uniref:Uncharacterized protein n=1 Tax=Ignelater luminosus TaxID=2038154 RepID=A0A8K0CSA8_IGNLU|nr:hypothetical protein ILUMI_16445 [Ignelater luminosus]